MPFQVPPNRQSLCDSLNFPPVSPRGPAPSAGRSSRMPPNASSQRPLRAERGCAPTRTPGLAPPTSAGAPPPQPHPGSVRHAGAPARPRLPVPGPPRACAVPAPPLSRAGEGLRRGRGRGGWECRAPLPSGDPPVRALGLVGTGPPGGAGVFRWGKGLSVGCRPASPRPSVPV